MNKSTLILLQVVVALLISISLFMAVKVQFEPTFGTFTKLAFSLLFSGLAWFGGYTFQQGLVIYRLQFAKARK